MTRAVAGSQVTILPFCFMFGKLAAELKNMSQKSACFTFDEGLVLDPRQRVWQEITSRAMDESHT